MKYLTLALYLCTMIYAGTGVGLLYGIDSYTTATIHGCVGATGVAYEIGQCLGEWQPAYAGATGTINGTGGFYYLDAAWFPENITINQSSITGGAGTGVTVFPQAGMGVVEQIKQIPICAWGFIIVLLLIILWFATKRKKKEQPKKQRL